MSKPSFQAPKGTRDLYPADMLRRRYITDAWRRVALRHGFDEIDGPTFETADLYAVKSGDGILGEMFGVYSGKDPGDIELVQQGKPPFALRPEFTPTLARMYAARARQLPQPTKWFCVSNFFRAERPQRGRLREFWQWNVDVLGCERPGEFDAEVICVSSDAFAEFGLCGHVHIDVNHRNVLKNVLRINVHVPQALIEAAFAVADEAEKLDDSKLATTFRGRVIDDQTMALTFVSELRKARAVRIPLREMKSTVDQNADQSLDWTSLLGALSESGKIDECVYAPALARGLAYYTGTVFEVIAEGERAVAGGGRYDNLIELFGGPPTPACGFGMGDVVLGNLLDDKGLMPDGPAMLTALSRPMPVRPDAFIIAANDDAAAHITPLTARLRRGTESKAWLSRDDRKPWDRDRYESADRQADPAVPPLHARRTYKSTRNVGKLLADANACHARFAVILETPETATIKNLTTGEQQQGLPTSSVASVIAESLPR